MNGIESFVVIARKDRKHCPFDESELQCRSKKIDKAKGKPMDVDYKYCERCSRQFLLHTQICSLREDGVIFHVDEVMPETDIKQKQIVNKIKEIESDQQKKNVQKSKRITLSVLQPWERQEINSRKRSYMCSYPGCPDEVFRNGLCWEHFQYELGELS